jgi:hypothetical protein
VPVGTKVVSLRIPYAFHRFINVDALPPPPSLHLLLPLLIREVIRAIKLIVDEGWAMYS